MPIFQTLADYEKWRRQQLRRRLSIEAAQRKGGSDPLTIDAYVRADGTADNLAAANNPAAAGSSLSLVTLDTLAAAGSIPAGTVIGFSSQGGDYASTNGSFTGPPDRALQYQGMVNMADGVTYTNVPGEQVLFDAATYTSTFAGNPPISVFVTVAGENPAYTRVVGQTQVGPSGVAGKIQVENTAGTSSGLCRPNTGGDGQYNVIFENLDLGGNYGVAGTWNDIFSLQGTSTATVKNCRIVDAYDKNGTGPTASNQVFTAHATSKLRVFDCTVTEFHELALGATDSEITLNGVTATGCNDNGRLLSLGIGGDITYNNCTLDGGSGANHTGLQLLSGAGAEGYKLLLNNCTITFGPNQQAGSWVAGTAEFHNCTINWNAAAAAALMGTGANERSLLMYDCDLTFAGAHTNYMFEVNHTDYDDYQFHRCRFDMRDATGNWSFIRHDPPTGFTHRAGTGFFACEIFDIDSVSGFLQFFQNDTGNNGWKFKQCTFVTTSDLRPIVYLKNSPSTDTTTVVDFKNCHFSGTGTSYQIMRANAGAATADYCSFYDEDVADDAFASNTNAVPCATLAEEGFADKANYDLTITSASNLYHAGDTVAATGVTTDVKGLSYNSAAASIGANEVD